MRSGSATGHATGDERTGVQHARVSGQGLGIHPAFSWVSLDVMEVSWTSPSSSTCIIVQAVRGLRPDGFWSSWNIVGNAFAFIKRNVCHLLHVSLSSFLVSVCSQRRTEQSSAVPRLDSSPGGAPMDKTNFVHHGLNEFSSVWPETSQFIMCPTRPALGSQRRDTETDKISVRH